MVVHAPETGFLIIHLPEGYFPVTAGQLMWKAQYNTELFHRLGNWERLITQATVHTKSLLHQSNRTKNCAFQVAVNCLRPELYTLLQFLCKLWFWTLEVLLQYWCFAGWLSDCKLQIDKAYAVVQCRVFSPQVYPSHLCGVLTTNLQSTIQCWLANTTLQSLVIAFVLCICQPTLKAP